uniref:Uncharacterized protein n=1 Tax=Sphaerodactylus townsendi TaxID=933632 RepID=A0ACB8FPN7_9SAUR
MVGHSICLLGWKRYAFEEVGLRGQHLGLDTSLDITPAGYAGENDIPAKGVACQKRHEGRLTQLLLREEDAEIQAVRRLQVVFCWKAEDLEELGQVPARVNKVRSKVCRSAGPAGVLSMGGCYSPCWIWSHALASIAFLPRRSPLYRIGARTSGCIAMSGHALGWSGLQLPRIELASKSVLLLLQWTLRHALSCETLGCLKLGRELLELTARVK